MRKCCFIEQMNFFCVKKKKKNKVKKEILILKGIALVSKAFMWCWALKPDSPINDY